MKRILCIMVLVMATGHIARSCDLCGCSASSQYLGLLPQQYKNFIGLQYQYASFTANQPSIFDKQEIEHADEYINTYQLWGRYSISKKVQLFAFIPYHQNRGIDVTTPIKTDGIGDISLLANVVVLQQDDYSKKLKHTLLAGCGIKAPTGANTGITKLDEQGLPNVQAGTGAWDFIANTNYTLSYNKTGINLDASYTITTANKERYKYGNHLNSSLLAYYQLQQKKVILLPQAGIKYEYSLHDYDNFSKKWLNDNSGGNLVFAAAGIQAFYNHYGARLLYSTPLSQHYAGGNVTTHSRLETSVYLLF
jgi:hypothetical protein